MGGYAPDELEDRFQLYYKAKDTDEYWVYLRITGWGACNADTSGSAFEPVAGAALRLARGAVHAFGPFSLLAILCRWSQDGGGHHVDRHRTRL